MTNQTYHDSSVEETALAFLLQDFTTLQEHATKIEPDLFEDKRFKAIWDSASIYCERYHGLIDDKGLEVLLDEAHAPAEKKTEYHTLLKNLATRKISRSQFALALDQLQQLKQKRKLYDLASYIAEQLKSPTFDVGKVNDEAAKRVFGLTSGDSSKLFRETSLRDTLQARIDEYKDRESNPQKYLGIPFGIKALDDLTAGIFPEEFAVFYGRGASGKSRTLASVAYNMFSTGHNVMHVTIEMPGAQVGRLFDSRHFLISSTGLRHGRLSDPEKKKYFGGSLANQPGDFYVVDTPQGCTYLDLLSVIRRYKSQRPLHAIVIDYLNLMRPATRGTDGNESLRVGTIGRELKALARLEKVAVLSATTATRAVSEIDNIDDVGTEHVGWSDLLVYQCDLMVYLKKGDAASSLTKTVEGVVVKYRDGANVRISLGADWDKSFVGDMDTYLKITGAITPAPLPGGKDAAQPATEVKLTTDQNKPAPTEKTEAAIRPPEVQTAKAPNVEQGSGSVGEVKK